MAVIIYCKHPTSVVPYTVKTSISKCTVTYIHVNVHNFIPFGFFWVTTCIHTIHTIPTSNSLTEIKRNTMYKRPVFIYQYIYKQNTSFDLLQKHLHINFMLFINSLSKESIIATSTLILYKNSTTMKHDKLQMIF